MQAKQQSSNKKYAQMITEKSFVLCVAAVAAT
jgi:hypothetical protein